MFVGGFLVIALAAALFQYKASLPEKKVIIIQKIAVKQIISAGDKKIQKTIFVKPGSTALQTLSLSHKVAMKGENENAYITAIDGRGASDSGREFWAFYVNGKQAEVGAGSYKVKNNDTIEWRIETY